MTNRGGFGRPFLCTLHYDLLDLAKSFASRTRYQHHLLRGGGVDRGLDCAGGY